MVSKIVFKKLLSRKDLEVLITSEFAYEKAELIVSRLCDIGLNSVNNEYILTVISKLIFESYKSLSEDATELLDIKYKGIWKKILGNNSSIQPYLPQVMVLLQSTHLKEEKVHSERQTSNDFQETTDIFTTEEPPAVEVPIKNVKSKKTTPAKKNARDLKYSLDDDLAFRKQFQKEKAPKDEDIFNDEDIDGIVEFD